jgi:membrane protein
MKILKRRYSIRQNKLFKVIVFAVRGFREDRCDLRASALTLFTLLSIVPVMAMAFGIAKGFGFQEVLEARVLELFAGNEEIIQNVLTFSTNLLEKTQGGLMAVLGVLFLGFSLLKLIGHIENAFNTIWWVADDRQLIRKFTDYIAISITAGILVIFSSSANIFVTAYLERFLAAIALPGSLQDWVSLGFSIFPFITIWILFIFFYIFIPNKKIDIKAALAGGMIAGTIFQLAQIIYLKAQVGLSHYNAIYGSFAALPLFLIWLQTSWAIVLFGAEIAFSWENTETLETRDIEYSRLSLRLRKLIVLRMVHLCVSRFSKKEFPASDIEIATEIKIPLKIIKVLLKNLVECRILLEVNLQDGYGVGYVPAQDIETFSIQDVLTAFEKRGDNVIEVGGTIEFEALEQSLDTFEDASRASAGERIFKNM